MSGTPTSREEQRQRFQEGQENEGQKLREGTTGGNNDLEVVIEYTDTTGERRSIEKTVPIQFRAGGGGGTTGFSGGQLHQGQQTGSSKLKGILITVLVVVVGLGFYFYKKKKLRDKIQDIVKRKK
ncbi:MAG: LPXTG cell wall anchor domain-containing protein [Nanoarchaeota archaeon]|nr:LPXTG cell wall anchor domain-containing protein [Nanoarchaeota archaeon]